MSLDDRSGTHQCQDDVNPNHVGQNGGESPDENLNSVRPGGSYMCHGLNWFRAKPLPEPMNNNNRQLPGKWKFNQNTFFSRNAFTTVSCKLVAISKQKSYYFAGVILRCILKIENVYIMSQMSLKPVSKHSIEINRHWTSSYGRQAKALGYLNQLLQKPTDAYHMYVIRPQLVL